MHNASNLDSIAISAESMLSLIGLAMAAAESDWPERADADEAPHNPGQLFWEGTDAGCFDAYHNRLYAPLELYCCDDNGKTHTVVFAESTVGDASDLLTAVVVAIDAQVTQ